MLLLWYITSLAARPTLFARLELRSDWADVVLHSKKGVLTEELTTLRLATIRPGKFGNYEACCLESENYVFEDIILVAYCILMTNNSPFPQTIFRFPKYG